MNEAEHNELAGRIDGVCRVLMWLIADLERRELIDGERFCRDMRRSAPDRMQYPGLEASARVIAEIANELDDARISRRSGEHRF